jgi:uncharacterized protein YaiE (UPF0345 family)
VVFKNVDIHGKAHILHEGNVTSRTVVTAAGEMKSMGIMLPGTYRFTTQSPETFEIIQGHCRVRLGDDPNWDEYAPGESFDIAADSHFEIEVTDVLDYVCHQGTFGGPSASGV